MAVSAVNENRTGDECGHVLANHVVAESDVGCESKQSRCDAVSVDPGKIGLEEVGIPVEVDVILCLSTSMLITS
ncbi:hypothetical protein DC31_02240 [Microbacterium sp. CH12i]|nr:hypothetical protein DC31_02240 [Microbacterium sp. CH12i]